jgi:hypothetical protein
VAEVMGVPSQRPPENPITEKVAAMFAAIDEGDAPNARQLLSQLQAWARGYPEADLARADLMIRRLEAQAKKGEATAS